ncbi:heme NO-binding domain-containing protein, partial [Escherichia coli]|nr:heme NO-binding domain-containing protein [Escherichia coli]
MKGIIFTEFMELVEEKFGLDVLDQVLDLSN